MTVKQIEKKMVQRYAYLLDRAEIYRQAEKRYGQLAEFMEGRAIEVAHLYNDIFGVSITSALKAYRAEHHKEEKDV